MTKKFILGHEVPRGERYFRDFDWSELSVYIPRARTIKARAALWAMHRSISQYQSGKQWMTYRDGKVGNLYNNELIGRFVPLNPLSARLR